jgi:cytoskeletal protein CcmA (bactofilin family)
MSPKGDGINSIIGKGSVFQGKFKVEGSIQVDGKFEGELTSEQQVIIGETGLINTTGVLKSQKIIIAGVMMGNVVGEDSVTLLETGKMLGNIETKNLQVEKGIIFEGNVKIKGEGGGSIKKEVQDSYSEDEFRSLEEESSKIL